MPEADAAKYKWNVFDITKVWPHGDYPLIKVGKLVLNRNPENYFAEIEQVAFSPSHMVPGIEPSADKMLQGRLFSYPDTHRHRLGGNYDQIPVNCPYRSRLANGIRDGPMVVNGNQGSKPNYEPNTSDPYTVRPDARNSNQTIRGLANRHKPNHPNSDFEQPGALFRKVMDAQAKTNTINNLVGHLQNAKPALQERQVRNFYKADAEFGTRIAQGLGIPVHRAKL